MGDLRVRFDKEISKGLQKELSLKSNMEVPRLKKISVSVCLSEAVKNPKILESVQKEITLITGQKAVITKAKKAISNFKLRKGIPLGVRVTLRKDRMWSFFEKLVHVSVPRIKDFQGFPRKSFDGRGNYSFGLKEQILFPEINYDKVDKIRGMNVTVSTTAKTDDAGRALLESLGFPLRKK